VRFNNLCVHVSRNTWNRKVPPSPPFHKLLVHRCSYGVALINFRHVDIQPRLIRTKIRKSIKVVPWGEGDGEEARVRAAARIVARGRARKGGGLAAAPRPRQKAGKISDAPD